MEFSRRHFTLSLMGTAFAGGCSRRDDPLTQMIVQTEEKLGARIGFAAVDLTSWHSFSHRADERFAMCSTFKWALAGIVLTMVQDEKITLDDPIAFTKDDLVPYAPVVEANLKKGALSVKDLCAAAVSVSDNVAANLLLRLVGGPKGFTQTIRAFGDTTTRLDRWEPALNEHAPDDLRDTSTPSAMIDLMGTMLFGGRARLNKISRDHLTGWMINATTGRNRLRAGFPDNWIVGDKTGTSGHGAFNDIAFAFPEGAQTPILMACYIHAPNANGVDVNSVHADLARAIVKRFQL